MSRTSNILEAAPTSAGGDGSLPSLETDPRWLLAKRVATSKHFAKSKFLASFLLYICEKCLLHHTYEITEQQIGEHVFRRPQGYNPGDDNIVRNYARHLRRRLAEYFETEGRSEPFHIQIPVGGYIPVFEPASFAQTLPAEDPLETQAPQPAPQAEPAPPTPRPQKMWTPNARLMTLLAVYSVALVALTWAVVSPQVASWLGTLFHAPSPADSVKPLWASLFGGPASCYIVPSDAALNNLEGRLHRPIPLGDYVNGSYLDAPLPQLDAFSSEDLRTQEFSSFTDLQIITALAHLPDFNPERTILRFPRRLQLDDLKVSNAILIGSMGSNPWAAIAERNANFRIVNGEAMQSATIVNSKPLPGEAPSYESHWNQPEHETYAIIAYLPNLGGSGHLLLLQGLDIAGTQAAAEALIHPAAVASILQQATRPDGSLRSFEILLRSSSIASRSAGAQVIGSRIY